MSEKQVAIMKMFTEIKEFLVKNIQGNKKDVALVLSSGGARGLAHIGAIEELEARGYHIKSIAGTSMGGLLAMYVNSPNAIKVAVNPCIEIERVLRKIGYGKHPYLQPRENGETEYTIDEPMIRQFITFRETHTPILGIRNIALFSTDDELIGREFSKKNAAILEFLGYEIYWNAKFGRRCNEQAAKQIKNILSGV